MSGCGCWGAGCGFSGSWGRRPDLEAHLADDPVLGGVLLGALDEGVVDPGGLGLLAVAVHRLQQSTGTVIENRLTPHLPCGKQARGVAALPRRALHFRPALHIGHLGIGGLVLIRLTVLHAGLPTMTLYGKSRLMVAACLIHVFCGHIALSKSATHYRYIVCTDMTHDDDNSLIRLLHYANEMDIEAIIVTDQGPESVKIPDWPNKMWKRAQEIITAYGKAVENLRLHDPRYPTADYFRRITQQGRGFAQRMTGSMDAGDQRFWDYVGENRDSDGSDYLQQVFDRKDERPIYVGFWGGSITFAQAMWRYQQKHSEEDIQALLDRLIFHCISFQDVTFDYFIDLDAMNPTPAGRRFYGDYEGQRRIPSVLLADIDHFWTYMGAIDDKMVHEYSGPLGDLYDSGGGHSRLP